jgi:hypothetical protein
MDCETLEVLERRVFAQDRDKSAWYLLVGFGSAMLHGALYSNGNSKDGVILEKTHLGPAPAEGITAVGGISVLRRMFSEVTGQAKLRGIELQLGVAYDIDALGFLYRYYDVGIWQKLNLRANSEQRFFRYSEEGRVVDLVSGIPI